MAERDFRWPILILLLLDFSVCSFGDEPKLRVGGWLDARLSAQIRDGTENAGFDAAHLYLIFDGRLNRNWRGFGEVEFEHAPAIDEAEALGEIKLDRLYVEYNSGSPFLNLRMGRFFTPFGIWTTQHWAILAETASKPFHEADKLVPGKQVGLEYFGNALFPSFELPFTVFVSNGSRASGTGRLGREIGYGADLNIYTRSNHEIGASFLGNDDLKAVVGYGKLSLFQDRLRGKSEILWIKNEVNGTSMPWYVNIKGEVLHGVWLGARHDDFITPEIDYRMVENVYINYYPISQVKLSLEWNLFIDSPNSTAPYSKFVFAAGAQF